MHLTIGLSYGPEENPRTRNYVNALRKAAAAIEHEVEVVDLAKHPERIPDVDGVLFTGGVDIQPARYGKQEEEQLCGEISESRDQAEFRVADAAEDRGIPVFGICRGLQLLNVHRGGSLVTDIQTFGGHDHKKIDQERDSRHHVTITPGSYLSKVLNHRGGEINSAHHQGAERIGEGLTVSARSADDGIVEALEWSDPTGKPFFLAVQWHPERMDYNEPLAGRLFETFLWEVAAHKTLKSRVGTLRVPRYGEEEATPPPTPGENGMR